MQKVAVVAHEGKLDRSGKQALKAALDAAGIKASWTMVPKAKKATKAARAAMDDGATVVIACGGDGTVRAAAQALVDTDTVLAVVPAGTANLFANAFALPSDPATVVDLVVERQHHRIDSAICNDMTFNVMAGTGFDARMIDDADNLKDRLGMLSYVRSGLHHARAQARFGARVTVDGSPFFEGEATCVLVGNIGTIKGGLTTLPAASPTDGRLDIAVVTAAGLKEWAGVLISAVRRKQAMSAHAHIGQGTDISVRLAEKHRYELDGGCKGTAKRLEFGIRASSLTICAPTS